jgi:cyclopropane fatty-acyl-phospholipid synthase-like methyltransferase
MTPALQDELREKNREIYDDTSGPVWQLAVYGPLHGGWEFINLGGRPVADRVARRIRLASDMTAIDLCAGQGAVSRYFASRYRCRVAAVEWNANQAACIRRRLAEDPALARLVDVYEADATSWVAPQPADAAFSMDSLMLLPAGDVIANAWRNLKAGGALAIVVICAGAQVTDKIRHFAWNVDGMLHLPDASWYEQTLAATGFTSIEAVDLTSVAVESSIRIESALDRAGNEIVAAAGHRALEGWKSVGRVYLQAFEERKLHYLLVAADKPRR